MSLEIANLAAQISRDKKAEDISLFDLRGKSDICSYQVICSAESDRQTRAIAEGIAESCKEKLGLTPSCIEGLGAGSWILLDYGPVIIHVFQRPIRLQFNLEKLWTERQAQLVPF